MNERDLIDNFATMFSIKSNSLAPGLDRRFISIQDTLAEFIGKLTNNNIEIDETNFVISRNTDKKFIKTKMPEFGK